ncbi:MAG: IclR family transcriptional regulator, partial [Planctomycetes bacterium]|nr:IclR family transcriptional regulator [Planctomycetota bacterium]
AVDVDDSGVAAFGAPVLDGSGRCILALGASVPLARANPARQRELRERLCTAAGAMSRALIDPST